jgi:polyphosphate kinase
VEICFPIKNKKIRDRILDDMNLYLKDNCQAWILQADGSYLQLTPEAGEARISAQESLLENLVN